MKWTQPSVRGQLMQGQASAGVAFDGPHASRHASNNARRRLTVVVLEVAREANRRSRHLNGELLQRGAGTTAQGARRGTGMSGCRILSAHGTGGTLLWPRYSFWP